MSNNLEFSHYLLIIATNINAKRRVDYRYIYILFMLTHKKFHYNKMGLYILERNIRTSLSDTSKLYLLLFYLILNESDIDVSVLNEDVKEIDEDWIIRYISGSTHDMFFSLRICVTILIINYYYKTKKVKQRIYQSLLKVLFKMPKTKKGYQLIIRILKVLCSEIDLAYESDVISIEQCLNKNNIIFPLIYLYKFRNRLDKVVMQSISKKILSSEKEIIQFYNENEYVYGPLLLNYMIIQIFKKVFL